MGCRCDANAPVAGSSQDQSAQWGNKSKSCCRVLFKGRVHGPEIQLQVSEQTK